jgi:hypothetical protein
LADPERSSTFIQSLQKIQTTGPKPQYLSLSLLLFTLMTVLGRDKNQLAPALF